MAITFRRNNVKIVVLLFVCLSLVLIWRIKTHSGNVAVATSMQNYEPIDHPDGPVLPQPMLEIKNTSRYTFSLEEMRSRAKKLNFEQAIKNKAKFGDHRADDPVIVVQAHDREKFLKLLLQSLKNVKGIEGATLVISRDLFSQEMDEVINGYIDFCRYLEIFFPFSMQLFPDKFPGEDPNDCSRDLSKSDARKKGCNNAEYPDMYGHYREVKFVQLKHHWYWKLNMVFMGIREIKGNTGPILMLEDDNYVTPDLIDVMRKAVTLRDAECSDCLAITLGSYESTTDYGALGTIADVKPWLSSKHNIGMVINEQFYEKLSTCNEYFCNYDDYNWDWTLQSTALKCSSIPLYTLIVRVPRVYHLGCTGFHQKRGGLCDVNAEVNKLKTILNSESPSLFPHSLKMQTISKTPNAAHIQNGGWGDIRDHELCQSYHKLCKTYSDIEEH